MRRLVLQVISLLPGIAHDVHPYFRIFSAQVEGDYRQRRFTLLCSIIMYTAYTDDVSTFGTIIAEVDDVWK